MCPCVPLVFLEVTLVCHWLGQVWGIPILPKSSVLPCDTVAAHPRHRRDTKVHLASRRGVWGRLWTCSSRLPRHRCDHTAATPLRQVTQFWCHKGVAETWGTIRFAADLHQFVDMPKSTQIIFPCLGRGGFDTRPYIYIYIYIYLYSCIFE